MLSICILYELFKKSTLLIISELSNQIIMKRKEFLQKGLVSSALIAHRPWYLHPILLTRKVRLKKLPGDMMSNIARLKLKDLLKANLIQARCLCYTASLR